MPVASYRVDFLSGLLAPFATLRSLLEAGGSTSKTLKPAMPGSHRAGSLAVYAEEDIRAWICNLAGHEDNYLRPRLNQHGVS